MKKIIALLVLVSVANIASADSIDVAFENLGAQFTVDGTVGANVTVQLVYNLGVIGLTTDVSGSNFGDQILSEFNTTDLYNGTWSDLGNMGGVYDLGTLMGYLSVRIFNVDDMGVGALYWQYDLDTDGVLMAFSATDTASTYKTDLNGLQGAEEVSITGGSFLDANGTVIPEPATIGLMGIAGLGMFLARRKVRR